MIRKWTSLGLVLALLLAFFPIPAKADVLTENLPEVVGTSYAVIDGDTGDMLFGKSYDTAFDPGSFTQVMTAILIIEKGNLKAEVTVPEIPTTVNTGNKVYLREGEKVALGDLLEALIVYNANDAAYAAALHIGGDEEGFIKMMNTKAEELGMTHTSFLSPFTGKEGQTSTAQDVALMAAYAATLETYADLASQETMSWKSDAWDKENVKNANQFSFYGKNHLGLMLNSRGDKYDLAGSLQDQGRTLVGVILEEGEAGNMYDEMVALLDYGLKNTQAQTILQKDEPMSTLVFGENKSVRVAAKESFSMITSSTEETNVTHNAVYQNIDLPIRTGDEVGVMKVYRDEEVVKEIPLVALDGARGSINWWSVITTLLALVYLASIAYRIFQQVRTRSHRPSRPMKAPSWAEKIPVPGRLAKTSKDNQGQGHGSKPAPSPGTVRGRRPSEDGKRQLEEKLQAKRQQRRPEDRSK